MAVRPPTILCLLLASAGTGAGSFPLHGRARAEPAPGPAPASAAEPLEAAIRDLASSFPERYPRGALHIEALASLKRRLDDPGAEDTAKLAAELEALRRQALIENPLVSGAPILFVVRPQYRSDHHSTETMFQKDEINTGSFQGGGAIKVIRFGSDAGAATLLEVPRGIARDPDVSFDGKKILFSMRRDISDDYHIFEMSVEGGEPRQLTFGAGITDIDPMYLPSGEIIFSSTREPKYCHCNRHIMANLFRMGAGGEGIRQIGRNILFEGHPALLPDGRILYDRWEYVDRHFGPSFGLWTVNPDGTNHALFYGNNSWSPGAILDARIVPGTEKFVATFGSCHDRPWGAIAIVDRARGLDGDAPVERIWPPGARELLRTSLNLGNGTEMGHPAGGQIDNFTRVQPKYEDPYPLGEKYFLASRTVEGKRMGIFLLDVFGNEILLHVEGPGCYDPMPVAPRAKPETTADRVDFSRSEGLLYVLDVYRGTGMEKVKRGEIKYLRIVEAPQKLFWTNGYWVIDATQAPAMNWNSTNSKRILGDVPVEEDGSAYFSVPSDRFVFFQALDSEKMMVQSMRSGTMVMPGERQGCVGCHESRLSAPPGRSPPLALRRPPSVIEPWYGPPRDFNYLTEVQPVLDKHCVRCHDFGKPAGEKIILAGDVGLAFNASYVDLRRKSPIRWFPDPPGAGKVLVKAVDDGPPEVLDPYAWGSHRSRLIDLVRSGHHDVALDREDFERIVTWIDMNAPYHGSYASAYPENAFGRSPLEGRELDRLRQLTGRGVGDVPSELQGSQVSFTRPALSPLLAGLENVKGAGGAKLPDVSRGPKEADGPRDLKEPDEPKDSRYLEALAIIRAGQERLSKAPRSDMPGCRLPENERWRQEKYDALTRAEAEARKALAGAR